MVNRRRIFPSSEHRRASVPWYYLFMGGKKNRGRVSNVTYDSFRKNGVAANPIIPPFRTCNKRVNFLAPLLQSRPAPWNYWRTRLMEKKKREREKPRKRRENGTAKVLEAVETRRRNRTESSVRRIGMCH